MPLKIIALSEQTAQISQYQEILFSKAVKALSAVDWFLIDFWRNSISEESQ